MLAILKKLTAVQASKRGGYNLKGTDGSVVAMVRNKDGKEIATLLAAAPDLARELAHLVQLLEPLERNGDLDVPGLATLNGARAALKKAGVL